MRPRIPGRMSGCVGAAILVWAGSLAAASAQGALDGDGRLATPVTLERRATEMRRLLGQLSDLAGVELSCEAEGADRVPVALSLSSVPLGEALEAIRLLYPDLEWKKTPKRGLALFSVHSARQVLYRNRSLSPRTPQAGEMFRLGMEFVRRYRRLAGPRRELLAGVSGCSFRELPADMRELARRMLRARLADMGPSRRHLVQVTEASLPDARVRFEQRRRATYTKYDLTLSGPNGEMIMLGFNDYKPVPVQDAPARDEAKEAAERARLLEGDRRFSRPVSLSLRDAPLQSALARLCEQAGVSYVWEGAEKHPDMRTVNIRRDPLKSAIRSLSSLYRFEWERSSDGILVIRKGRFDPQRLALDEARKRFSKVADEFDQLSPDERRRVEAGLPVGDLPYGLREAVTGLFRAMSALPRVPGDLSGRIITVQSKLDSFGRTQYDVEASGGPGPRSCIAFSR